MQFVDPFYVAGSVCIQPQLTNLICESAVQSDTETAQSSWRNTLYKACLHADYSPLADSSILWLAAMMIHFYDWKICDAFMILRLGFILVSCT